MTNYPFKIARNKFLNISLRTLASKVYYSYMKIKFSKYSSKFKIDYDWDSVNFNRTALLNYIIACHTKGINCAYLEIGCSINENFNAISLKDKVGVDPDIGGNVRLTSDQFFNENDQKFDLIFLDGLHTYAQTKKDLLNSLEVINDGGVIVLDDFVPRDWKEHFTPRVQTNWNGDVWKIAYELINSQGIDFRIIAIDGGQCVVFKDSNNFHIPCLHKELQDLNFDYLYNNLNKLPIIDLNKGLNWIREKL